MNNTIKQLAAFLQKEFLHVFRDKRTLLVMFGLPIAQILIFGFALTNEVKNARLLVVNPKASVESQKMIEKIDASSYFTVTHIVPSRKDLETYFRNNEAQCALILPDDFAESATKPVQLQIVADATDPNFAKTVVFYLSAIIGEFHQLQTAQSVPMKINSEVRMLYNPSLNGSMNFVPGVIALIMMIVCTTLTAIAIVREKEMGTIETLLVSPLKPFLLLISKAIPYAVLSLVNLSFILLLSNLVLDVPIRGSVVLMLTECFLYILSCLALGLMIPRWRSLLGTLFWLVRPRAQSLSRKKHNGDFSNGGSTVPTAPQATASISGLPPATHSRVLNRAGIPFQVRTIPIQQEMDL